MTTLFRGRAPGLILMLLAPALAVAASPWPAVGQVRAPRAPAQECRCVDADGKAIERCSCFTLPDVEGIVTRALAGARLGSRAMLGVTLVGDDAASGARVQSVLEGGPAEEAGIRAHDVITHVGGTSLLEPLGHERERHFDPDGSLPVQRLVALLGDIEPEGEIEIEYLRDGVGRTATVRTRAADRWTLVAPGTPGWDGQLFRQGLDAMQRGLGEMRVVIPRMRDGAREITIWADSARGPRVFFRTDPEARGMLFPGTPRTPRPLRECPGSEGRAPLALRFEACPGGLELVALNPGLATYFGTEHGVLVAAVHERSRLGLQGGDVVLEVDGREAGDPNRLRTILSSYGADEEVTLKVVRQRRETTVRGSLGH